MKENPWRPLLDSLNQFSEDFMIDRAQPSHQTREDLLIIPENFPESRDLSLKTGCLIR